MSLSRAQNIYLCSQTLTYNCKKVTKTETSLIRSDEVMKG